MPAMSLEEMRARVQLARNVRDDLIDGKYLGTAGLAATPESLDQIADQWEMAWAVCDRLEEIRDELRLARRAREDGDAVRR